MSKILVVDDEKNIRDALQEFLTGEGHEVSLAEDGHRGLERFKNEDYDLIFMDVKMPGIDGIETLHQMKQSKPSAKVVIITGIPDEHTFDRAVSVSPDIIHGFLAKPFKPDDIRKCLQIIFGGGKIQTFELNPKQVEALSKLGNICAENASRVCCQVIQQETKMTLQKIDILSLQKVLKVPQEEISPYIELSVNVLGEITGKILIILSLKKGLILVDLLEKRHIGITNIYDEKAQTMLKTAANIFSGAYLNAVTQLLKLSTQPSIPELRFESKEKIFDSIIEEMTKDNTIRETEYIFTVRTVLKIAGTDTECEILFVPDLDSVKIILHTLGALQ